ncbi:hydroxyethylthiazole kinase [Oleisolibacter albus]|uniref:hydroxyethylthiazole kinase n=1 Tax=Oleisolibacter albus TaxID=2171757 RepID=UPI000DF412F4|nr:hydroxyethylthiazole kinase [Oleisolibacter albus]
MASHNTASDQAADLLAALRQRRPLVQNITNYVAMDLSANGLLAIGASPAMVHAVEEAASFAVLAEALVVNIGTLSAAWVEAMTQAARAAGAAGRPWVLDPVAVGATDFRNRTARDLCTLRPTVIRGNASEILALHQQGQGGGHGVDSRHSSDEAREVARDLARSLGCVVAMTGAVDYVTDGDRLLAVENGHPLLGLVTATGCTVSAIVAAFLPLSNDPVMAAAAALAVFGLAGEQAAAGAAGPGSFRVGLLDALYQLTPDDVRTGARIR